VKRCPIPITNLETRSNINPDVINADTPPTKYSNVPAIKEIRLPKL
jgi:hypothetical protein